MTQQAFGIALRAGLVIGLTIVGPLDALARGGGFGGQAGGFGHAGAGYARGAYGRGPSIGFGSRQGVQGRIGFGGGRGVRGASYYPSGGFGAPGYYPIGSAYPYPANYGSSATPTSITTRSVIIRRGPAFGEPGYVAHPVVYRLVPGESRRPGLRRFKVERLDF